VHTLRISSRSSSNPSATEDIQNCLNLSFNCCSCIAGGSVSFLDGKKEGSVAGGGDGDGEYFRIGFGALLSCLPRGESTFTASCSSSSPDELESEDSDEDEDDGDKGPG